MSEKKKSLVPLVEAKVPTVAVEVLGLKLQPENHNMNEEKTFTK